MTIDLGRCSVDPYLFENFNTLDGDKLTARFKAFKFPETNYVLFRGTIDVCLDTCTGVWPLTFNISIPGFRSLFSLWGIQRAAHFHRLLLKSIRLRLRQGLIFECLRSLQRLFPSFYRSFEILWGLFRNRSPQFDCVLICKRRWSAATAR